jgi:hypothetical protein
MDDDDDDESFALESLESMLNSAPKPKASSLDVDEGGQTAEDESLKDAAVQEDEEEENKENGVAMKDIVLLDSPSDTDHSSQPLSSRGRVAKRRRVTSLSLSQKVNTKKQRTAKEKSGTDNDSGASLGHSDDDDGGGGGEEQKEQQQTESASRRRTQFKCQVCGKTLTHYTVEQRAQHANRCLDAQTEHLKAKHRKRHLDGDGSAHQDIDGQFYFCRLCGADLSEHTSTKRLTHVKRCSSANGKAAAAKRSSDKKAASKRKQRGRAAADSASTSSAKKKTGKCRGGAKRNVIRRSKFFADEQAAAAAAAAANASAVAPLSSTFLHKLQSFERGGGGSRSTDDDDDSKDNGSDGAVVAVVDDNNDERSDAKSDADNESVLGTAFTQSNVDERIEHLFKPRIADSGGATGESGAGSDSDSDIVSCTPRLAPSSFDAARSLATASSRRSHVSGSDSGSAGGGAGSSLWTKSRASLTERPYSASLSKSTVSSRAAAAAKQSLSKSLASGNMIISVPQIDCDEDDDQEKEKEEKEEDDDDDDDDESDGEMFYQDDVKRKQQIDDDVLAPTRYDYDDDDNDDSERLLNNVGFDQLAAAIVQRLPHEYKRAVGELTRSHRWHCEALARQRDAAIEAAQTAYLASIARLQLTKDRELVELNRRYQVPNEFALFAERAEGATETPPTRRRLTPAVSSSPAVAAKRRLATTSTMTRAVDMMRRSFSASPIELSDDDEAPTGWNRQPLRHHQLLLTPPLMPLPVDEAAEPFSPISSGGATNDLLAPIPSISKCLATTTTTSKTRKRREMAESSESSEKAKKKARKPKSAEAAALAQMTPGTRKTHRKDSLLKRVAEFIRVRSFYSDVLLYNSIDIRFLHRKLTEAGVRISHAALSDYLVTEGVSFKDPEKKGKCHA